MSKPRLGKAQRAAKRRFYEELDLRKRLNQAEAHAERETRSKLGSHVLRLLQGKPREGRGTDPDSFKAATHTGNSRVWWLWGNGLKEPKPDYLKASLSIRSAGSGSGHIAKPWERSSRVPKPMKPFSEGDDLAKPVSEVKVASRKLKNGKVRETFREIGLPGSVPFKAR